MIIVPYNSLNGVGQDARPTGVVNRSAIHIALLWSAGVNLIVVLQGQTENQPA